MASSPAGLDNSLGTSLDDTVGSLYFAAMFSMGLWGAGTVQLYIYYNNYPKDALWLKTYVFTVWFLDTLHQALLIGMSHGYLILGFGNFNILLTLDPLLVCALFVGGVVCVMVQAIFVMRIWKLSERNIFLVIFVASLVVAQFGATCLYFVKAVQADTFKDLMGAMTITRIVNSVTAAADSTIALSLVILLHRTRSGFRRSETTINRLILFTINTGLVTSICAILGLVLGCVLFDTLLFMFFYLSIARLYANSFLAALNSRNSLRRSLIKASSSFGVLNVPPTEVLKTVTRQTNHDDRSPAPLIVEAPNRSEGSTAASQFSDTVADNTISSGSYYSQSLYSVVLDDIERPSNASTPIKSQFPRSSDNWI
ncbi:hypothetical protein A7U60_g2199 [Sanghuangporus baumii]|uniref:DUF6534 domain-containing protein n=1 Tax=Sanghuangporus baumii TaxID=108892 RepID=A0A9Q5I2N1_SANBA|nr:hypothetical protein A7U60_g2199 [Sanghuangporus baumii]